MPTPAPKPDQVNHQLPSAAVSAEALGRKLDAREQVSVPDSVSLLNKHAQRSNAIGKSPPAAEPTRDVPAPAAGSGGSASGVPAEEPGLAASLALFRGRGQLVPEFDPEFFNPRFTAKFKGSCGNLRPSKTTAFLALLREELGYPSGFQVCWSLAANSPDKDQRLSSKRRSAIRISVWQRDADHMTLDASKQGHCPTGVLDKRCTYALAARNPRVVRHQLTTHPQPGATMHKHLDPVCFSAPFNRRCSTSAGLD